MNNPLYPALLKKLSEGAELTKNEYLELIRNRETVRDMASELARAERDRSYGPCIFVRGLIEFTNCCRNDCYYCGIRRSNTNIRRYRLSPEDILSCVDTGYGLGFRTFVMQGGEDPYYTDDILSDIIRSIKELHPDCAVTLSAGERSYESYRKLREAGADRYLLRHETVNPGHYARLHPSSMSHKERTNRLKMLMELGFQTGAGFMVGSPYQTEEDLADELIFLRGLRPHMVGIGPFIPHKDTPFAGMEAGSSELTVFMLSLIRLTLPYVLLPATTALNTVDPQGRIKGINSGANVLMPNLTPEDLRNDYSLYDNKLTSGPGAAANIGLLKDLVRATGCTIVTDRGDCRYI
ncbi:MAG: [FeFe] hydrogenase H-cluster radical SAM maturase HydE [Lachnospiraceae bacterium]|nr:[FeFe] hydrogenase H-cluster radical SAM maturase HydE [Lachnospiraceae bacterium]